MEQRGAVEPQRVVAAEADRLARSDPLDPEGGAVGERHNAGTGDAAIQLQGHPGAVLDQPVIAQRRADSECRALGGGGEADHAGPAVADIGEAGCVAGIDRAAMTREDDAAAVVQAVGEEGSGGSSQAEAAGVGHAEQRGRAVRIHRGEGRAKAHACRSGERERSGVVQIQRIDRRGGTGHGHHSVVAEAVRMRAAAVGEEHLVALAIDADAAGVGHAMGVESHAVAGQAHRTAVGDATIAAIGESGVRRAAVGVQNEAAGIVQPACEEVGLPRAGVDDKARGGAVVDRGSVDIDEGTDIARGAEAAAIGQGPKRGDRAKAAADGNDAAIDKACQRQSAFGLQGGTGDGERDGWAGECVAGAGLHHGTRHIDDGALRGGRRRPGGPVPNIAPGTAGTADPAIHRRQQRDQGAAKPVRLRGQDVLAVIPGQGDALGDTAGHGTQHIAGKRRGGGGKRGEVEHIADGKAEDGGGHMGVGAERERLAGAIEADELAGRHLVVKHRAGTLALKQDGARAGDLALHLGGFTLADDEMAIIGQRRFNHRLAAARAGVEGDQRGNRGVHRLSRVGLDSRAGHVNAEGEEIRGGADRAVIGQSVRIKPGLMAVEDDLAAIGNHTEISGSPVRRH